MTHAGLRALAGRTVDELNRFGIGRNDRVAMVLPNGPEMAAGFLAIASGATTAPLNPSYKAEEFDFYLSDLNARALVIQQGMDSPARAVAVQKNIPIIELIPEGHAGNFMLVPGSALSSPTQHPGQAQPDDIALVLHTSGTTSRPKIVPLSHRNITASAYHIGEALRLTPDDVCLNIMPLFHIHGLIAATLSSIAAGGAVYCTPGFNAFRFFSQFDEVRPTWYTAVPTMHQAIEGLAARNRELIARGRLRFIRSSSASLPPQVMDAVEKVFGVPVIESYGMTEAAHQMASNPLPPRPHFAGSVGIAAGPDIAVMDDAGNILSQGELGEIVMNVHVCRFEASRRCAAPQQLVQALLGAAGNPQNGLVGKKKVQQAIGHLVDFCDVAAGIAFKSASNRFNQLLFDPFMFCQAPGRNEFCQGLR